MLEEACLVGDKVLHALDVTSLAAAVAEALHVKANEIVALLSEMLSEVGVSFTVVSVSMNVKHNPLSQLRLGWEPVSSHFDFLAVLLRLERKEVNLWKLHVVEIDETQPSIVLSLVLSPLLLEVFYSNGATVGLLALPVLPGHLIAVHHRNWVGDL